MADAAPAGAGRAPRARVGAGLAGGLLLMAGCASGGHPRPPATTVATAAMTTAVAAASPSTTAATPVDPATLPQTATRPTAADPAFRARMALLWQAVVDGSPATAMPAFFPRLAYLQVKAIRDPAADWQNRLIGAFDRDLSALHAGLGGAPATFLSVDVPDGAAVWVRPGQEYNKIGYWRVYGTRLRYSVAGRARSFGVFSLISWRGEWYVVHLTSTG